MAGEDRILKILLQLVADTAGATQVTSALKEIETQAVATAETVSAANKAAVTGATAPMDWNKLAQERTAALASIAAMDTESVAKAQAAALAQTMINAQMERRVVLETQIEAAEARLAGNPALAASLEREAEIRARSLGIQRTLNITTEESIALAEKLVLAEEAQVAPTALAGVNLAKMRQEAIVLSRELAVGNVRASTLGSLLGSFGTSITLASIAGYELYRIILGTAEAALEVAKNTEKQTREIHNAVAEWIILAKQAQSFGDEVKLADKMQTELDKMAVEMADFRAKQLPLWQSFADTITHYFGSAIPGFGPRPFQASADAQKVAAQERYNQTLRAANAELDIAKRSVEDWAKAEANLPAGITLYTQKVSDLQGKLDQLDVARHLNPTDAKTLSNYHEVLKQLDDAKAKLNQLGDEQDKLNKKVAAENRKDVTAELREQQQLIEHIREQQQLITASPFLGADQKAKLSLQSDVQELQQLQVEMGKLQAIKAGPLDPVQLETVNQKLQQTQFQFDLLREKISGLQQPLLASLTAWTNSFGTSMQQVGKTIQGTINASLQQFNQLILTGKFNTGQLLQQIVQLGLTLIEQLILQRAMMAINSAFSVGQATASGPAIAAAYAPAATMVSIATEGQADIQAPIAVAGALAAIQGMAFAESGGLTSGLTIAGEAGPEYIFSTPAVRNIGVQNLEAAHSAARGMSSPGAVTSTSSPGRGGTNHHFALFYDKQAALGHLKDRDGRKTIIDIVRGEMSHLGLQS